MEKNQNTLLIVFITGIVLIAIILVLNPGQTKVINTAAEQQNAITVSGAASIEVEPDKADIYLRIETFSERAEDAKDQNAALSGDVRKALKNSGVKDEDIETASFYLSPRYKYDRDTGESILQGYVLTNVLKVTTNDVDGTGKIIDAAIDAGANGVDTVSFGLAKETEKEASSQALVKAAQLAGGKASSLANSLGIKLGKIISVQESSFNIIPFDYAPRALAVEDAPATEISPEKVEVSAHVTVSYEIG